MDVVAKAEAEQLTEVGQVGDAAGPHQGVGVTRTCQERREQHVAVPWSQLTCEGKRGKDSFVCSWLDVVRERPSCGRVAGV